MRPPAAHHPCGLNYCKGQAVASFTCWVKFENYKSTRLRATVSRFLQICMPSDLVAAGRYKSFAGDVWAEIGVIKRFVSYCHAFFNAMEQPVKVAEMLKPICQTQVFAAVSGPVRQTQASKTGSPH